jgi:hypothetical protein
VKSATLERQEGQPHRQELPRSRRRDARRGRYVGLDSRRPRTKPATAPSAADVRKSDGAGALVYKDRDNARVTDNGDSAKSGTVHKTRVVETVAGDEAEASAYATSLTPTEVPYPWWKWVEHYCEFRRRAMCDAVGQCLGEFRAQAREHCAREVGVVKRELELTRRELTVLREEVRVERGLRELRRQVVTAQKAVPKLPAIVDEFNARQADLEAEQARLERELAKTKDRLGKVRVNQSVADYQLSELRKQVDASAGASVELEFESRSSHFQMKATHPDAAKALREFAAGIINGQADGTVWLPGPAGNA